MLIDALSHQLLYARELDEARRLLASGEDATISAGQSARSLLLAAFWSDNPRPCLLVVSGEDAAERAAHALVAYLGSESVCRYPERRDLPWQNATPSDAAIGARCRAIARLAAAEPCIVVASARSLMRCVPPKGSGYYASSTFAVGDELDFHDIPALLVGMGYTNDDSVDEPGSFRVRGDAIDVFPAQASTPVRIEFFGDEIDQIRRMVASTGQTIGSLDEVEVAPCREMALTDETVARAERALFKAAQNNNDLAADLELIRQRAAAPELERYLVELYGGSTSPLAHISSETLVVLAEPRVLFDDCTRAYDEIGTLAKNARVNPEGLILSPREMDFGTQQRLSFASILRAGTTITGELEVRQPNIAGADTKLMGRVRQFLRDRFAVVFAVPERATREALMLRFSDENIPFGFWPESDTEGEYPLMSASTGSAGAHDGDSRGYSPSATPVLPCDRVTFTDAPIPAGVVIPSARLAVLSIADLTPRSARARKRARRVDPTTVTFPFKPGDYVVHATHGIALFTAIVRQEVAGKERDYFLLQYAAGDKFYVPLEQVDKLTRYVGPDGSAPRLTRLGTADWSRATGKARANAKKLAFDLVDLYARRAAVVGHAFAPDTPAQEQMEQDFSYELTLDQVSAIADIKADMESKKPMDRLLCGDVGFGKTEVALRAAFKCCQDLKQVMVLCPTTILAQQHFETFCTRFAPYGLKVAVLSRFVTPAAQRRALAGFAEGKIDVLIGTHRLLSADVNPHDLGLVIVDEEQRFGVQHKEHLKNLREQVDVLTLSATPIPRTMQMAVSGVRDMSMILTPPPGRLSVKVTLSEYDPDLVSAAIRQELGRGGQVYYVSNRVHSIDEAVERVLEAAPEARVGVAHGQMSAREVEDVMLFFQEHEIDVLVATTIIESGIDNPHTNTLIIEDSQRLGLAQLYQLKGRVGRGRVQAYAYFMFPAEFDLTDEAAQRLAAIKEFQELGSGVHIAMRDLEIRGAGSLMGAEQHGNLSGVGFDLFTQMLGEAVAEARGEAPDPEPVEITLNLPADVYLAEEYVPDVDKRVLLYRRIAAAHELADVDVIEADCDKEFGAAPLAAHNLFDRARIRIRAQRLGLESISLGGGRLTFMGIDVPRNKAFALKSKGALVYPTSRKLTWPFKRTQEEVLPVVLSILEELGGDDSEEE